MKELAIVTKEQAIKLKELGFDWECDRNFTKKADYSLRDTLFNWNDPMFFGSLISCPTVALAIQWCDEKGVYVEMRAKPQPDKQTNFTVHFTTMNEFGNYEWHFVKGESGSKLFSSRSEAMSAGLDAALDYLTTKPTT